MKGNNSDLFHAKTTGFILPTNNWSTVWVALVSMYLIIIAVLSIVGNISTIVVLTKMKKHKKMVMNNQVLLSLAVADFLVGVLVIPCTVDVVIYGQWRAGTIMGYINAAANFCFCISSIVHLSLLSIDRYISVSLPLRYQTIMSSRRTAIFCLISWIYSSSWAIIPGLTDYTSFECFIPYIGECKTEHWASNTESSVFTVSVIFFTFGISALTLCFIYIRIFQIIRIQKKKLKCATNLGRLSTSHYVTDHMTPSQVEKQRRNNASIKKQSLRSQKGILIIVLIICLYLIAWTPFCAFLFVEFIMRTKMVNSWGIVTMFIGFGNSACNPVIYCMKYRTFRLTLWKMLMKGRRQLISPSTDTQGRRSESH
ncbi:beta-2 adrenergic receptor-like [Exaiptasia diaphana]|uniref:G-protein coupled receptors family 1 profile domain-containing protein n=1 Tax=Exaiptasia diaphana TaxID=2652724 RepID=A0A913Y5U5_EXADI|nr:beta-2 adrenergic receptor-like [Exaiptasia diaphana]